MLASVYDPKQTEDRIYRRWEASGYFNPDRLPGERTEPFVVYMPLPNITGTLHMGHALDNTLPDALVRYYRMKGRRTLWLPGTDHAGIATQYIVEKQLKKEGVSRFDIGREAFIEKVWEWKREYGDIIISQLKKLGVSADWSRTRFTMDPAYAADVTRAFIHYHEKGWLYRGFRTVNWCPRCATSLSELELEYRDEDAMLWYIKYSDRVTVATTRPETMLGDTAVAVNPTDERYRNVVGTTVTLPLTGRIIPVVADQAIDPAFGTGAVKVTPAHDVTDYEIGERHKLETLQVIDARGRMTAATGAAYEGLTAAEARTRVVVALEQEGRIVKIEPYPHRVAVCYRCASVIEPIPSAQWFLKMNELAKRALEAVAGGAVRIRPENFSKVYTNWLGNIRDWTVSRQIWWGHRLPVYFCKNKQEAGEEKGQKSARGGSASGGKKDVITSEQYVVAEERPTTCPFCKQCEMKQSEDVLDTWFSSALWPFAGRSAADLATYYPGNLVSNARDILNLWDARMIFSGLEFMGAAPFHDVLIHGTIQTKDGKRMSKSLGTGIDPLTYIEKFGADATRFAVLWQSSGQDIRWDESAAVAGRKFANKIWNAARFVQGITNNGSTSPSAVSSGPNGSPSLEPPRAESRDKQPTTNNTKPKTEASIKILEALAQAKASVARDLEQFEFSQALRTAYDFFWHEVCDTYIEVAKRELMDPALAEQTSATLLHVLRGSLKLLHPFMPFVTEELWSALPDYKPDHLLMVERW